MDSKGTDYGMYSRYKAELHLDGRQMALDYMETIDTEELIKVSKNSMIAGINYFNSCLQVV